MRCSSCGLLFRLHEDLRDHLPCPNGPPPADLEARVRLLERRIAEIAAAARPLLAVVDRRLTRQRAADDLIVVRGGPGLDEGTTTLGQLRALAEAVRLAARDVG